MKNRNYPIILGNRFKKGIIVCSVPNEPGYRVAICRLKSQYKTGESFGVDDIESIESEMWFEDRKTLQTMVDLLNRVLADPEEKERDQEGG